MHDDGDKYKPDNLSINNDIMAKKEILENNENQLTKEEMYQLAKECFEKEDYEQD